MKLSSANFQEQLDSARLEGANNLQLADLTLEELVYLYGNKITPVLLALLGISVSALSISGCAKPSDPDVLPSARNNEQRAEDLSNYSYKFYASETLPGAQCSTNKFNVYGLDQATYVKDIEFFMDTNNLQLGSFYGFDTIKDHLCNRLAY